MKISRAVLGVLAGCMALLAGCSGADDSHVLHIFFTADVEGVFWSRPEPRLDNKEAGGYGVLKSFLNAQTGEYLLFDGGNWFGAVPEGTMSDKNTYVAELLPAIGYTAGTLSDNDFMFGWANLREIVKNLSYPFVVSNLRLDNQLPWPLHDYQIRQVGDIKVGIFGLMDDQTINKNETRWRGISALNPLDTAKEMAERLRGKGVDYVILLSALGVPKEKGMDDNTIAQEAEGIDLILSSNQDNEKPESEKINNTLIVYPGARFDSVAHIAVSFDKNKQVKNVVFTDEILLKEKYGEDEELARRAQNLREMARQKMTRHIADAAEDIPTSFEHQSPAGYMLAQCVAKWARIDGAILNGASVRSGFSEGPITEYDLYNAYPYADNITFITIKTEAFMRALQASLNAQDNFPQIAGFTAEYQKVPAGKLVKRVVLDNGHVLRPKESYRFAVTDHILAGGFEHDEFINATEFKNTFVEAREIMRTCLSRQKQLRKDPAYSQKWKQVN
jgi:2',3'-cyclic-nucleotide 2'-phosphodiesterase (5'-nucleotidase family)